MTDSPEQYLQQCKPQFGRSNPERMRFAHWEWMVRTGKDPYWVRSQLGVSAHLRKCKTAQGAESHPDWCFDRFGMTRTRMSDGRIICIGGEHEDSYDPDFCIYNDVVVLRPALGEDWVTLESGEVEIYGYPRFVFEPTDFHSATLVERTIFIVGCLGYWDKRHPRRTPVLALDTNTYEMTRIKTSGQHPGWIFEHHASYDATRHAITVRGGSIWSKNLEDSVQHFGAYRLDLKAMRWERITEEEAHRKFLLCGHGYRRGEFYEPTAATFESTNPDIKALEPEDRGIDVFRIDVLGVRLSFEVWVHEIHVTVEGDLDGEFIYSALGEIRTRLQTESGHEWDIKEVDRFPD